MSKQFKTFPLDDTYFYVELDVKEKPSPSSSLRQPTAIFRTSHFIKPISKENFCFMEDYKWKPGVQINLIATVKNQRIWFLYMLEMLSGILERTHETNVSIILKMFDSINNLINTLKV